RHLPGPSLSCRGNLIFKFAPGYVTCDRFGEEAEIQKQSRKAQFEACPQSRAQRRSGANLGSGVESAQGADTLGEICFRDFSPTDLGNSQPNIFYRLRARSGDTTIVGRRRILV